MTSWRFRHYGLQVAFIFLLLAGLACAVDPADKAVDQALHQLASGETPHIVSAPTPASDPPSLLFESAPVLLELQAHDVELKRAAQSQHLDQAELIKQRLADELREQVLLEQQSYRIRARGDGSKNKGKGDQQDDREKAKNNSKGDGDGSKSGDKHDGDSQSQGQRNDGDDNNQGKRNDGDNHSQGQRNDGDSSNTGDKHGDDGRGDRDSSNSGNKRGDDGRGDRDSSNSGDKHGDDGRGDRDSSNSGDKHGDDGRGDGDSSNSGNKRGDDGRGDRDSSNSGDKHGDDGRDDGEHSQSQGKHGDADSSQSDGKHQSNGSDQQDDNKESRRGQHQNDGRSADQPHSDGGERGDGDRSDQHSSGEGDRSSNSSSSGSGNRHQNDNSQGNNDPAQQYSDPDTTVSQQRRDDDEPRGNSGHDDSRSGSYGDGPNQQNYDEGGVTYSSGGNVYSSHQHHQHQPPRQPHQHRYHRHRGNHRHRHQNGMPRYHGGQHSHSNQGGQQYGHHSSVPYQSQPTIDIPVGDDSSFIVSGNSANYVTFYGGRISSTSFDITFEILGRGNAHIGFLANRTQRATQAYEVVIGGWGNTASVIRYGTEGTDLVHFQGPQLSETEFRPFWISLANGVMSVGNGHRFGASQFMSALVPRIGGVHELYIGWAAWDTALTFRYKGATSSCMRIDYNPFDDVVPTTPPPKPPAPTDCTVSDWFWSMSQTPVRPDPYGNITIHDSECSTRCGGGFARQERHILVNPSNGGASCPDLIRTVPCNTKRCHERCSVGDWSPWTECSARCGGGLQKQFRTIYSSTYTDNSCPTSLVQERPCNTHDCPVDCKVSEFGSWSPCSTSCGGGISVRSRYVMQHAINGGRLCPHLTEWQTCGDKPCPPQCKVSEWSEWSECSLPCGGGMQTATRTIQFSGYNCPPPSELVQTRPCGLDRCSVDCLVGEWEHSGPCTADCGTGYQKYTRSILRMPAFGGMPCPVLEKWGPCNVGSCDTRCGVTRWGDWTPCTKSCGGGIQNQTRSSEWSFAVSGTAGHYRRFLPSTLNASSFQLKFRAKAMADVMIAFMPNAVTSAEKAIEVALCADQNSKALVRYGTKSSTQHALLAETQGVFCDPYEMRPFWISFEDDTLTVGQGSSVGDKTFLTASLDDYSLSADSLYVGFAGRDSPVRVSVQQSVCPQDHWQTRSCNLQPCPVDCIVSDWSPWSPCSTGCGNGRRVRTRSVLRLPAFGGSACPILRESKQCNTHACPADCKVSSWQAWSACSVPCGGGTQTQNRTVVSAASNGGIECPSLLSQTRPCNQHPCPVDCIVSDWHATRLPRKISIDVDGNQGLYQHFAPDVVEASSFSFQFEAQSTCDLYIAIMKSKTEQSSSAFEIVLGGASGGSQAQSMIRYGTHAEALVVASGQTVQSSFSHYWVSFDGHTLSVGAGKMVGSHLIISSLMPTIDASQLYIGFAAGDCAARYRLKERIPDEETWMPCSARCGGGRQIRNRDVVQYPAFGGKECPEMIQSRPCNTQECKPECQVSPWSEFSDCSVKCGPGGVKVRTRTINSDGDNCPLNLIDRQPCNWQPCLVDCQMSEWSEWSTCSSICGGGRQYSTRTVLTVPSWDGKPCGAQYKTQACNLDACVPICSVSAWSKFSECSAKCGGGTRFATRTVTAGPSNGNYVCPSSTRLEESCNTQPCSIDCSLSEWSEWSACSMTCGGGNQIRTRSILRPAVRGGQECPSKLVESRSCNTDACSSECDIGEWTSWSSCSKKCTDLDGPGMQTAVRHIGKVASVSVHVQSSCDEQREHNTGRIVIGNRDFDLPSSTNQLYVYHIDADGELKRSNGTLDRDSNLLFSATEDMSGSLIAVVHFGGGVPMSTANHRALHRLGSNVFTLFEPTVPPRQTRHHHHHHHHHHHGQDQGQDQDYNDQHVFAAPDGWTYVFVRSQGQVLLDSHQLSCGAQSWSGHIQTRAAKVDQCPSSGFARRPCNQFPCPVDCKLGPWSDWSVCTSKCGGGTQFQRREVLQMNNAFGRACADTVHWQSCNEHPCPRDCNVTAWSEWSQCSRICGGGTQYRTRSINIKASWGGTACPSSIYEELECNSSPCLQPTPTPVVCDEGDSCAPTPAPPTPPPCQNTCPWFHAEPNLGQYRRFDSSKVSATEFSILFEAKACGNALIAFMPQQREQMPTNSYEVLLGGWDNTQSVVRAGTQGMTLASYRHQPFAASCDEFRSFWITLQEGVLSVGSGKVAGKNSFLVANVPPVVGTDCDCLLVGFGAWSSQVTYRYCPPAEVCGGLRCLGGYALPATTREGSEPEVIGTVEEDDGDNNRPNVNNSTHQHDHDDNHDGHRHNESNPSHHRDHHGHNETNSAHQHDRDDNDDGNRRNQTNSTHHNDHGRDDDRDSNSNT